MGDPILSFGGRKRNDSLILDLRDLGWIKPEDKVLDPTYGRGGFWNLWQPEGLTKTDVVPTLSPDAAHGVDARVLHLRFDPVFDVVVLDGPYKLNGTPSSGGPANSDERYGVHVPSRWEERIDLIKDMMGSASKVLNKSGSSKPRMLVKCQDQVVSGKKRFQTHIFTNEGEKLGFRLADMLHVEGYRPQPEGRRQIHSRQDYSTMLVFEWKK